MGKQLGEYLAQKSKGNEVKRAKELADISGRNVSAVKREAEKQRSAWTEQIQSKKNAIAKKKCRKKRGR